MDKAMGEPVATKEESGTVDLSESETWSFQEEEVTVKPVAYKTATRKPGARKEWPHNLHMSPATVPHTDAVFSIVRKYTKESPVDPVEDLDVNAAVWGLGQDYEVNLRFVKNHLWNSVEQLFNETGRLIRDQTEIIGVIPENLHGDRQAHRAAELIRSQMPLPTSSPTQCFVWEKWEMIRLQLGMTKLNGNRRTITSRN